jgi:hypothetical protein
MNPVNIRARAVARRAWMINHDYVRAYVNAAKGRAIAPNCKDDTRQEAMLIAIAGMKKMPENFLCAK